MERNGKKWKGQEKARKGQGMNGKEWKGKNGIGEDIKDNYRISASWNQ